MLSIGEFSRICNVSTKTLRYYDEIGLLKPDEINEASGYRYYAIDQLKTMLLINRLKGYQLSLDEIGALLRGDADGEGLRAALYRKRDALRGQLAAFEETIGQMDADIATIERGIPIMAYLDKIEVQLTQTEPMNILFLRKQISTDEYGMYLGKLFETVVAEHLTVQGPPMFIYHSPDFDPQRSDVEFALPVAERVKGTRDMPGYLCARAIHKGPYSGLSATYARLQEWMETEGYEITDAPFEKYIGDPRATPDPNELITEVYFPVRKMA